MNELAYKAFDFEKEKPFIMESGEGNKMSSYGNLRKTESERPWYSMWTFMMP